MATCPSCGKDIRDGDWTCGSCGAPVAGASPSAGPAAYGAPTAAAAPASGSGTTLIIMVAAVVAVIAILVVWFLFVRGGGSPFDGSWNASESSMGAIVISGSGNDFKVKITGTDVSGEKKSYSVPAHRDGADLVITMDDFVKASGNEDQASQAKALFEALIKDFRLVFTLQDSTHLKMTVEGTLANGQTPNASQQSIVLTKSD